MWTRSKHNPKSNSSTCQVDQIHMCAGQCGSLALLIIVFYARGPQGTKWVHSPGQWYKESICIINHQIGFRICVEVVIRAKPPQVSHNLPIGIWRLFTPTVIWWWLAIAATTRRWDTAALWGAITRTVTPIQSSQVRHSITNKTYIN